jgi:cytochrome P450
MRGRDYQGAMRIQPSWLSDLSDPDTFLDGPPYELFRKMRDEAPVVWSGRPPTWDVQLDDPSGWWNVTRAEDITRVSQDWETYSSWLGGVFIRPNDIASLEELRTMMSGKDGEPHQRQRLTVNKVFTPGRVAKLEPKIRARVIELLDVIVDAPSCDLMTDFAAPLAVHMIGDLLGIPDLDRDRLALWADAIASPNDPDLAHIDGSAVFGEAAAYLFGILQARATDPQDDLITALGQVTYDDGASMDPQDQVGVFLQLIGAAIDSTRSTIGSGTRALIENPKQFAALADDPGRARAAVEEMLRYNTAFTYFRRTATVDTELAGVEISAGDAVVLWYPSGSRDDRVVDRPDEFDITRPAICPHQAFGGGGRHFCLGSALVRQELVVVFEEIARRVGAIEFAGTPARTRSNLINGYKKFPVRLSSPAAVRR